MIFSTDDLRCYVVRDTLHQLDEYSPAAENLLLGTAAQESSLGLRMKEGRRLGLYHITPLTHRAIWDKYLINHPDLLNNVRGIASQQSFLQNPHRELITNLRYATAIAWMIYRRAERPLPSAEDPYSLAIFWHRHFHSRPVANTQAFVDSYQKWVAPGSALAA